MSTFNIHEAKTNFSRLVGDAVAGKEVGIAKAGRPVARLVPIGTDGFSEQPRRRLGLLAGEMIVHDDVNDPLPDDMLAALGNRDRT